jgi:hypothetical protein
MVKSFIISFSCYRSPADLTGCVMGMGLRCASMVYDGYKDEYVATYGVARTLSSYYYHYHYYTDTPYYKTPL